MIRRSSALCLSLMLGAAPGAVLAQDADRPRMATGASQDMAGDDLGEEIFVTGERQRGSVMGDIKPEQQLSPADIRAFGVTSVSELLSELAPQVNAAGGSPVVLLNGKRISAFAEIQDLPAEAIARVDILPEQVALSYGYSPNQKVVNIVLRQRFRAELADVRGGIATDGGRENGNLNGSILRIRGDNRFTLDLKYSRAAQLLESERGVTSAAPSRPFALGGNITALTTGGEIDPSLSALAGQTVTVAPVPGGAANAAPALGDFVAGANSASVSDVSRYRTLSPATESFSANATLARALGNVSTSINGRIELSDSDSLQGLPSLALTLPGGSPFSPFVNDTRLYRYLDQAGALAQQVRGTTGHVGVTLNGGLMKGWQWSFTGAGDLSDTRTRTDRGFSPNAAQSLLNAGDGTFNPYGALPDAVLSDRLTDRAKSRYRAVVGDLLLSGSLFDLPAGTATTSITLGASANGFDSSSMRSGTAFNASYSREIVSGQASIDLPITSRSRDVLGAIGDLGVNINAGVQELSDFGTLSTLGYGLRWTPVTQVRFLVSASQDRAAPTGQQINDPSIITPNVSVFDYARGETVFITQISGGNAALNESVRDQFRVGVTIKPLQKTNLTLTANYLNSRTSNPISAFPSPTPAIEAAFPQRFMRDEDGALLQIDSRPINFLRSQSEQLRWGVDLSIPIKSAIQKKFEAWRANGSKPEERPTDLRALFGNRGPGGDRPGGEGGNRDDNNQRNQGPGGPGQGAGGDRGPGGGGPGGGGPGGGGFGGGRGPGGGQGGGRIQLSLYHTWHLTESILIAPGVPMLDLLDGDATGSSGGQPRHEIEARAGYVNNGLGARLSVNWESGTHVDGALGGNSRLDFGSLATADLRLFANLGQMPALVKNHPFLRGARVSLGITNIFNTRRNVTDATGATPLRYQPGYLDPIGRAVTLSFRKLFF
ncbi:TonB-dependent receptor [Sphingobium phenoxybenzoativorans]|uniref:TonB-dependent receptor n=1 Tax=Sphingobium phenoxybenzoativorans TaxID=1592790 RepID=A0A975K7K2_9SPHN|nr:TonB-dependent receptor [Sphingobium phenoxybenzoativorans]QUT04927.1 TonB-dependent receptor [Sphingobium phenoxybenzoativorans]